MPPGIISEGLNSHSHSRNTGFLAKGKPEEFSQTPYSTLTELAQQFPVIEKELTQGFGDGENILTVGNRIENSFLEVMAELDHFLIVTAWTEPPPPATERQNILVKAIRAFYSSEALAKIAAFKDREKHDIPIVNRGPGRPKKR